MRLKRYITELSKKRPTDIIYAYLPNHFKATIYMLDSGLEDEQEEDIYFEVDAFNTSNWA